VYCGSEKISWKKFAVAVELFVEVETATHRLSEVMKKDPRFYHVPGWFEYVSALGASLLVEATGKLFRRYKPEENHLEVNDSFDSEADSEAEESDDEEASETGSSNGAIAVNPHHDATLRYRPLGQPLLTLEYLVSSLSIFEVTTPHDAVYALLAIAKDTTPTADSRGGFRSVFKKTQDVLEGYTQKKLYRVDYRQPFADVCMEFVTFCIDRSIDRVDPTRALDIICRPWAPDQEAKSIRKTQLKRNRSVEQMRPKLDKSPSAKRVRGSRARLENASQRSVYPAWAPETPDSARAAQRQQLSPYGKDIPLPSWIPTLSGAAYAMSPAAGVHTMKMGRKNADPLVGLPPSSQALERNYNAAETRGVVKEKLKFIKRTKMSHWSMYVEGFVLDEVFEIQPSSQSGAIPRSWARAGKWAGVPESDPPDDFWRTLVADRGRDGRNPPVYYSRACKESFAKGGFYSGSVNTTDLINNERCSVIAQFCRRVQAVIWNRCLITTEAGTLGLTSQDARQGDRICILYGCSVPVVLRRFTKDRGSILQEMNEDLRVLADRIKEHFRRLLEERCYRRKVKNCDWALNFAFEKRMRHEWSEDPNGLQSWLTRYRSAQFLPDNRNERHYRVTMEGEPEEFILAPNEMENAQGLLERRAYEEWRKTQRKDPQNVKGFKRSDRRLFEIQLRWARRWRRIYRRRQRNDTAAGANGVAANGSHSLAPSPTAPRSSMNGPRPEAPVEPEYKSDAYLERWEEQYLQPFRRDKTGPLEEPDWKPTEEPETLRLQEQWSYYKFLGECYVHGMMDGEAMRYQNEKSIAPQVFELR
jgi:hypothetical protein